MMSPMLTCLSVQIDTCKRAWVLVCMYVRTCVSGKADLYVQLLFQFDEVVQTTDQAGVERSCFPHAYPLLALFFCS